MYEEFVGRTTPTWRLDQPVQALAYPDKLLHLRTQADLERLKRKEAAVAASRAARKADIRAALEVRVRAAEAAAVVDYLGMSPQEHAQVEQDKLRREEAAATAARAARKADYRAALEAQIRAAEAAAVVDDVGMSPQERKLNAPLLATAARALAA